MSVPLLESLGFQQELCFQTSTWNARLYFDLKTWKLPQCEKVNTYQTTPVCCPDQRPCNTSNIGIMYLPRLVSQKETPSKLDNNSSNNSNNNNNNNNKNNNNNNNKNNNNNNKLELEQELETLALPLPLVPLALALPLPSHHQHSPTNAKHPTPISPQTNLLRYIIHHVAHTTNQRHLWHLPQFRMVSRFGRWAPSAIVINAVIWG